MTAPVDVLLVSLGSTGGLRAADSELLGALRRAGADVEVVAARTPREVRTFALTDLVWARAARAATLAGLACHRPRALLYCTSTAALLGPRRGAIRFDAPAAANRPGRHGVWQRPLERRRLAAAPLLVPYTEDSLLEAGLDPRSPRAVVVPVAIEPVLQTGVAGARDVAAVTYAANPEKKGLDRVLSAWRRVRRDDETLVVCGTDGAGDEPGVDVRGALAPEEFRSLLGRARVFVSAARREDYGQSQLEALADGCLLVTTQAPGPYAALPLARELDARLVGDDLVTAIRVALDYDDASRAAYSSRAAELLAPFRRDAVDRIVAERLLPALLKRAAP